MSGQKINKFEMEERLIGPAALILVHKLLKAI